MLAEYVAFPPPEWFVQAPTRLSFALVERGRLQTGQSVLVEGMGGADYGIDRRREHWVEAVLGLTGDRGIDHILEIVGGHHLGKAI